MCRITLKNSEIMLDYHSDLVYSITIAREQQRQAKVENDVTARCTGDNNTTAGTG